MMFCLFGASECVKLLDKCYEDKTELIQMHSSEVAVGPALLQQVGRMVIRARSRSPAAGTHPSTSKQVQIQPLPDIDEVSPGLDAQLSAHVNALWTDHAPLCIEVSLGPRCGECGRRGGSLLLLERWTLRALPQKAECVPTFSCAQWLVSAVRSQLHFSQLSAWNHTLHDGAGNNVDNRRKLSRETCNIKKLEANCDDEETSNEENDLNIVYTIRADKNTNNDFITKPIDHTFPLTDLGNNTFLKVTLQSLPRFDEIPIVPCRCPKRRLSKDTTGTHQEIVSKLNDLTIGAKASKFSELGALNNSLQCRRLSIIHNTDTQLLYTTENKIVDDRMHTPCSENGKHKCNCDDESDTQNQKSSTVKQETKNIDEKRLKEIAKYKRRLRKESKIRKLCDSTSSEGDKSKETTSIPILQASRFDRFRAIGCYRNQTYLTLPATRIEYKSPFVESVTIPSAAFKKTNTIATQTDDVVCNCGKILQCDHRGIVRSEANYNLADIDLAKRSHDGDDNISKKHKCDKPSVSAKCDVDLNRDASGKDDNTIIKRPKLRRLFPLVDKIERIVTDRFGLNSEKDIEELHLKKDDTVFSTPKTDTKRQKTFSISEDDYVFYEKSDYGTFDRCELESPNELNNFNFNPDAKQKNLYNPSTFNPLTTSNLYSSPETTPEDKNQWVYPTKLENNNSYHSLTPNSDDNVSSNTISPNSDTSELTSISDSSKSTSETPDLGPASSERFHYRFDSAASMIFNTKTGLPLTSSPAPLRKGKNSFDFDESINGISGIKSAFPRPPPPDTPPPAPISPTSPAPTTRPRKERRENSNIKYKPNKCLLGSFEECALQGRLQWAGAVSGFTAELCAAGGGGAGGGGGSGGGGGIQCAPHARLPVTVLYYMNSTAHAPYMGHIDLGPSGYRVPPAGTIQLSLFNPHRTLVKMFCVTYSLTNMPPKTRTFLRQRTYYVPANGSAVLEASQLRYLIHLRFMTSKSGKLYLHTDIRLIVSRKADLDAATAHTAIMRSISTNPNADKPPKKQNSQLPTNDSAATNRSPNRVFGGCDNYESKMRELGYDNQNDAYELRSYTYAPDNPKYSPR